jgi:probable F420-dependent oxidoreductase
VKVGYVIRNSGTDAVRSVRNMPKIAEDLGFSTVWLTDHVIGVRAFAPVYEAEWAEIVVCLAHMAATTTTIRLGTGVLVVPYRDPVLTAKMLATIDNLSDGRLTLGVGTGWSKAEFAALGQLDNFDPRGVVTDESIDVMLRCWQGGEFDWAGTAFQFRNMTFEPQPVQSPHPPIWIGGQSGPALRRAARIGDAWHPTNIPAAEVARLGTTLDQLAGRSVPRTIRLNVDADKFDSVADALAEYEAAGCVEAALQVRHDRYDYDLHVELMQQLAKTLQLS